jgi:hypothetical protein
MERRNKKREEKGQEPEVEWRSGRFTWLYCRPLQASPDPREPRQVVYIHTCRHYSPPSSLATLFRLPVFSSFDAILFRFSSTFTPAGLGSSPSRNVSWNKNQGKKKRRRCFRLRQGTATTTLYCIIIILQ